MSRLLPVSVILFVLLSCPAFAQTVGWLQGFGDATGSTEIDMMHRLPDGGVVIAGSFTGRTLTMGGFTLLNAGQSDAFVAYLDRNGNVLHAMSIGDAGVDYASAVAADGEGNVYVGVCFESLTITLGGSVFLNRGERDAALIKACPDGRVDWIWHVGTAGDDRISGLAVDNSGSVFAATHTQDTHPVQSNVTVSKFDAHKTLLWQRRAVSREAAIRSLAVDSDGVCFIAGSMYYPLTFDDRYSLDGNYRAFLVSYTTDGEWRGGVTDSTFSSINALTIHGSAVYAAGENVQSYFGWGWPNADSKILLARYDGRLQKIWQCAAGGTEPMRSLDIVRDVQVGPDGSVYLAGSFHTPAIRFAGDSIRNEYNKPYFYTQAFVLVYDSTGREVRGAGFGGPLNDGASSVVVMDDRYILAGTFESDFLELESMSVINTAPTREVYVHQCPARTGRDARSFLARFSMRKTDRRPPVSPDAMVLYPNPVQHFLRVESGAAIGSLYTVSVHAMDGRTVLMRCGLHTGPPLLLDVSTLPPGIYVLAARYGPHTMSHRFVRGT
ncbi:MAG: hypothetical protein M5R41_06380 [Bacteroidia bacterium]|nr:hypothetical protein [Bacteroidia bacterium]